MGKLSLGELDSIINRKREQDEYPKAAAPYINDIDAAADRYGVPREYARRLVQTESNFNPNAVSPAGAQGLMQIVPKWHPNVDPFNPKEAIDYGIRYFRENADRFGRDGQPDWRAGAAAYNAGPGTVERRGMDNLPAETRAYVPKVIGEGQPSQPASPQRKTRLSFNDIDSIINPQEEGFLSKAATMGGALVKGLAEGVTTEIPGMLGGAAQFAGSKLGAEGVEEGGRELKEWAEKKSKEWFGESDYEGAAKWIHEGSKMLGPSVIPAGAAIGAFRTLLGVGRAVKVANATKKATDIARASMLAKRANALGSASNAVAVFGLSQAQNTIDNAEQTAQQLEAQGDIEGARRAREAAQGIVPYITGAIEAAGEYYGTKYLGKLFGLDEAGVLREGTEGLVKRFLKTLGVEVGTEVGQAGTQAAAEKISGIRPNADIMEEALGVIGPTAFMTLLTGGMAAAANRVGGKEKPSEPQVTPSGEVTTPTGEPVQEPAVEEAQPVEATMKDWEDSTRQTGLGDDEVAKEIISKVAYGPIEEKPTEAKRVGELKAILEGGIERGKRELKIPEPLKKGDIPGTEVDVGAQAREIARRKNAEALRSDTGRLYQERDTGPEGEGREDIQRDTQEGAEASGAEVSREEVGPLRYDPSVDQHNGEKLTRGDVLTDDEGNRYALDRDSGFMLTLTEIDEGGKPKGIKSFSVDPTDTDRFRNLYKAGENIYQPAPPEGTTAPADLPSVGAVTAPSEQAAVPAPTTEESSLVAPEAPVDQTGSGEAAPEINADEIIKGLEAKGFYGTIDRLNRGVISLEDAADELAGGKPKNIPVPKAVNPADFAAELKGAGVDRKESWSRWVQKTSLKPGMDVKDWYKIYDSATPSRRTQQAAPVASQEPAPGEPQAPLSGTGEAQKVEVARTFDNFKETDAPYIIEERLSQSGRTYEKKVYLPEAYKENMFKSDETGARVRWGVELSDGRLVSWEGAVRITKPELYNKIKNRLKGRARATTLWNALNKKEQTQAIEQLDWDQIVAIANEEIAQKGIDKNDVRRKYQALDTAFYKYLKENKHPFKDAWTTPGVLNPTVNKDIQWILHEHAYRGKPLPTSHLTQPTNAPETDSGNKGQGAEKGGGEDKGETPATKIVETGPAIYSGIKQYEIAKQFGGKQAGADRVDVEIKQHAKGSKEYYVQVSYYVPTKTGYPEKIEGMIADRLPLREAKKAARQYLDGVVDVSDGGRPIFSNEAAQPSFKRGAESTGLPKQEVVSITKKVSENWKGAPDFAIHSTQETLPDPVQAMMGDGDVVKGVLYDGVVHLVAPNLATEQDVIEAISHETFGHYGLKALGERGKLFAYQVYTSKKSAIADILKEPGYGFDVSTREGKIQAADEWLAREAQNNPESTWVDRAVRLIREFVRKLGFDVKLSDAEIRAWLADMRHVVVEGKAQAVRWGDARFMVAHHGSPHVWQPEPGFPHGRPRLDKIGTGEGGAAYGWGIYFAKEKNLAETYKETLFGGDKFQRDLWTRFKENFPEAAKAFSEDIGNAVSVSKIDDFVLGVELENFYRNNDDRHISEDTKRLLEAAAAEGYELPSRPEGSVYTLDIPDDVIPKLLDWDKPLSEQSGFVRNKIIDDDFLHRRMAEYRRVMNKDGLGEPKGLSVYHALVEKTGSDKAASEYLASIGIPGNTHGGVSQGATGAKYVIWDQDVLDRIALLERNGEKLDAIREEQEANPDIRFMRGKGEGWFEETKRPVTQEDYEANRKIKKDVKGNITRTIRQFKDEIKEGTDRYLGVISTRLGNINEGLKSKIRKLDFDINKSVAQDIADVEPLLRKASKMTATDKADWDYARKNSDKAKIDELVAKYGMEKEYAKYREVLDQIKRDAYEVGLTLGTIEEYAPRILKDPKGFLRAIGKEEDWPILSRLIDERAAAMGITSADMTLDQKANIVSSAILGVPMGLGGPSATKERKLKKIPPYLNQYYMDSDAALMHHIREMRNAIESRRFFGKIPEKVARIRTRMNEAEARIRELNKIVNDENLSQEERDEARKKRSRAIGRKKQYEAYLTKYAENRNYQDNIASYIVQLIANGEISAKDEKTVQEILNARFHERGSSGIVQAYKNFSYIDTMGSPISALTQIGDLAWAAYEGSFAKTLKHAYRAATGKSKITKEDVGIDRIAQEFADASTLSKALNLTFKYVGLEKIDSIGKEALLNSALEKYQAQARKNPVKLKSDIRKIFGNETDDVVQDLIDGEITDNVKLLVYNKLADFQPIALSEMPQKYLEAGNGRVFYMLKTFTLKQFDAFRRESYNKIKNGNREEKIQGMKNLVRLAMLFTLANAGADELKDWILGRKTDMEDRVVDNILRLFGVSKFVTWKARTEGVGSSLARQILPPFKFVDAAGKDIMSAGDEKGLELTASIPIVGKLYYWHMGRGVHKREDLWNRRLSKRKAKIQDVVEQYEKADNKREFFNKHRKELLESKRIGKFQSHLNKLKARANKLRKIEKQTPQIEGAIKRLENERIRLIKEYLDRVQ